MRSAHGATSGSTDVENEHNRNSRLIQGNPRSLRTIQEPLKVKTRELILRPLTYVRLECTKSLRFTSQHKVTHRAPPKILRLGSKWCTDTDASAELLVGVFQSRR